jgi:hypothetical protein
VAAARARGDRQLIVIVLGQLARGVKRVSWKRVRERLDAENSPRGLGMRYSRSITRIAQALSKRASRGPGPARMRPIRASPTLRLKRPSRR